MDSSAIEWETASPTHKREGSRALRGRGLLVSASNTRSPFAEGIRDSRTRRSKDAEDTIRTRVVRISVGGDTLLK
jgi:hypothetical protein